MSTPPSMTVPAPAEPPRLLPIWAYILTPLVATLIANADVALLFLRQPQHWTEQIRAALLATVPLSTIAGVATLWLLLRSRREMLRRLKAEQGVRLALDENKRALQRELMLRRELDHRVRNNLAGLVGLISLYEKSGRPSALLAHALRGKIIALKEVHEIINRSGGGPVRLRQLVERVAEALVPSNRLGAIHTDGPIVTLTTAEASAMAMVLQELVANSLKYGGLGARDGAVDIVWAGAPELGPGMIRLNWRESGHPAETPSPAAGSGVGIPLIEGFVRSDLHGRVSFDRDPSGWLVEIIASLATPTEPAQTPATATEVLS